MKKIRKDAEDRAFEPAYLIYGPEAYLRRELKNLLRKSLGGDDGLNYMYREGRDADMNEIRETAETVPFFAEKRLILLENTGWAKKGGDELADYLPEMPASTVLVMVEEEVDRRSKLFKAFSRCGYCAECRRMTEDELRQAMMQSVRKAGYRITRDALDLFLEYCGDDLGNLVSEKDKLLAYTWKTKEIRQEDVEAVTSLTLQNRVFSMIDAMALGRPREALLLYEDLKALREPPMRILYLMTQHIGRLLAVRELDEAGWSPGSIAEELKVKPFAAGKYLRQAKAFSAEEWQKRLEHLTACDQAVKSGELSDETAVELALVEISTR